ncbi:FAD-containing monooxygenase [Apiospora rasikravindrae]|uniref:FAD-containing monooxygenase n=1 Tax=Apiospora rasikravindrae TaxID=990691 RepID=A0ABR1SMD4_9PEZI
MAEIYDFIVVGAGLSGINTGYRLKTEVPEASYTILESRDKIGGTWSFFKFPGIRSDSQLTLFGFPWRPWLNEKDMASASLILEYIESAARDEGIDKKIQFQHQVTTIEWSSEEQLWTLGVEVAGKPQRKTLKAKFLLNCTGYYNYKKPMQTEIPGLDRFCGVVAHPQFWPEDLDYAGQRIIVVGSGATTITIVPVLAKTAAHVTMLQRSPSYVLSLDSVSPTGSLIKRYLPAWLAHPVNWWRCFAMEQLFVAFSLTFPNAARRLVRAQMKRQLPASVPADVHFNPSYLPFDQRLCLTPDNEFFKALHRDNCDIVTDKIETVVEDGIVTKSGQKIEADIIVTATGLHVELLGGRTPIVDGVPIRISEQYAWKGAMLTNLPNAGSVTGYTTSSWTLGADATVRLILRVYKHMKRVGATSVVPVFDGAGGKACAKPVVSHSSTYFQNARDRLPKITGDSPWHGRISPIYDMWQLWFGSITKGMKYTIPPSKKNV